MKTQKDYLKSLKKLFLEIDKTAREIKVDINGYEWYAIRGAVNGYLDAKIRIAESRKK